MTRPLPNRGTPSEAIRRPNTSRLVSLGLLAAAACGGAEPHPAPRQPAPHQPAAPPPAASPAPAPSAAGSPSPPSRPDYGSVFDTVALRIAKSHTFAPGRREFWEAHKASLRDEMAAATSRTEALVALRHLQLALGDRHCSLSPPTGMTPVSLSLGVRLYATVEEGQPVARVAELIDGELASQLQVGDVVEAVEGVPMSEYVRAHPFESNALNPEAALAETVASAVRQPAPWTMVKEDDRRRLTLRRPGGASFEVTLPFRKAYRFHRAVKERTVDDAPAMAQVSCTQEARAPYTGYAVATVGANFCVYRATARRGLPPIVRYLSFYYAGEARDNDAVLRGIRADHDLLKAAIGHDSRVLVDLRDNRGGNNPFIFVSWFAHAPWGHELVHVRTSDDFTDDEAREFLWGDQELVSSWREAVKAHKPEMQYSFLCRQASCDREGPRESELVTKNPVALITGTECTSSCDSFASLWSEFHLGPVVGKQPAHGFTSVRYAFPVTAPDHSDLGQFRVALSWEGFAGKPGLEGRAIPLDWEAKDTFDTRDTWVDQAIVEGGRLLSRSATSPRTSP